MIRNVLHAGFFNDHSLGGGIIFKKGLIKNGLSHQEFDYRIIANKIGIYKMNKLLIEKAKNKDLLLIDKGELISTLSLGKIREKGTKVALRYGDMRQAPESWLIKNLKECDAFFISSAGKTLERYYKLGKPRIAAFYLNPSDRELASKYSNVPSSIDPPIYTGTIYKHFGKEREEVYRYLCKRGDINIIGSPKHYIGNSFLRRIYIYLKPPYYVRGKKYIELIIRSQFGIGVSSFQNIKYYTSARLTHYLTFGKLFLAYFFPGCEDLLEDGKHIVFYKDIKDLEKEIEYYLKNTKEAEMIGRKGQEKILRDYNSEKMVRMMLEIIEYGDSSLYPWIEIHS